jgi:hypothetical protein
MNQDHIEDIFLAFANHSLRANPENLRKIFHEIEHHFYTDETEFTRARALIGLIVTLAKIKNPLTAAELIDEMLPPELNYFQTAAINTAFQAIYRYRDDYCESSCSFRGRRNRWGNSLFSGPSRLTCIECEQLEFAEILERIINGHDYREIDQFSSLIRSSCSCIKTKVILFESDGKTGIKEETHLQFPEVLSLDVPTIKCDFAEYLRSIMAYSLSKFLMQRENNRLRLKQCAWCSMFDTSGKAQKPRISPKTKKPFLTFCSGTSCKDDYYRGRRKEKKHSIFNMDSSQSGLR